MKALCWHGIGDARVDNVPDPIIEHPRDAIVRITASGICGSDVHLFNGFMPTMEKGDILGHEPMGVVVEVGSEIRNLKADDRVVITGLPTGFTRRVDATMAFIAPAARHPSCALISVSPIGFRFSRIKRQTGSRTSVNILPSLHKQVNVNLSHAGTIPAEWITKRRYHRVF